ncbi:hypothetical protein LSUB1_G006538 [Lachnellula subtilissima]|uniref:Uncharacterized protein n=1 Tax=Lachnellula subtilissima TaxID=602034 RepID=A0A8H8RDX7_9HELO|nr:hypothetical protein LSUB1_G006538 [Lachnellula subtilissima]
MSNTAPIFCCTAAVPVKTSIDNKPHHDLNRELHDAIFRSFLDFAIRRQRAGDLLKLIANGAGVDSCPKMTSPTAPPTPMLIPPFTLEALKDNPLTPQTPYCIHLTSRHDFGPVYSHRYFACPELLEDDWSEISLVQWFAEGEPFKMKAEKWDIKCVGDSKFFRLSLRPNLGMRNREQVFLGMNVEELEVSMKGTWEGLACQVPDCLVEQ